MIRIIYLFLSVVSSIEVYATAQAPDYLLYNGERHRLHVNPLEVLFLENKELRPKTEVISSGNWRGYIATFEISEGSLLVNDITISKPDPNKERGYIRESVLPTAFPNMSDRKMDWFSGLLVAPLGERTGYVHLAYASQYEKYLLIRIQDGTVSESAQMSLEEYTAFKGRQFEVFKTTTEYEAIYKELSKESEPEDNLNLEGFIFAMGGFTQKINIPFKLSNESLQSTEKASAD